MTMTYGAQMDNRVFGFAVSEKQMYDFVDVNYYGDGILPMTVLPPAAIQVETVRPEYHLEVRSLIATLRGLQDAVQYENKYKGLPSGDLTEHFTDACEMVKREIASLGIQSNSTYFDHAYHAEMELAQVGFPITYVLGDAPRLYITQTQFVAL